MPMKSQKKRIRLTKVALYELKIVTTEAVTEAVIVCIIKMKDDECSYACVIDRGSYKALVGFAGTAGPTKSAKSGR
jgi:hypothetical protein